MANNSLNFDLNVSIGQARRAFEDLRSGARSAAAQVNQALGSGSPAVKKQVVISSSWDDKGVRQYTVALKGAESAADKLAARLAKDAKLQSGSVTVLRQQLNTYRQQRDQIARFSSVTDAYGQSVKQVNKDWILQNQKVRGVERELARAEASGFWNRLKSEYNLSGLLSFSNGLVEITQGAQAASIVIGQLTGFVNQFTQAIGRLQEFSLAFEAIGAGAGGSAQALAESSRIALGLGVNIETVRQGFQQLTPVVKNSGGSIGDVSNIVEALSSRFAAFGITGERARRVTNGVIQAFAKGKLQAEELTQQISEADPAFKTDFARAVGISVAELERWVKAGQVGTDMLLEFLPEIGKSSLLFGRLGTSAIEASEALSRSEVTLGQFQAKLQTLNQLSLERLAKAFEPALVAILRIGAALTDFLDRVSRLGVASSLGSIFGGVAQAIAVAIEGLLRFAEAGFVVADTVARIVGFLSKLPGVLELVGVALAVRLAAPLRDIAARFTAVSKDGTSAFSVLLGPIRSFAAGAIQSLQGVVNAFSPLTERRQKIQALRLDSRGLRRQINEANQSIASFDRRIGIAQKKLNQLGARRQRAVITGLSPKDIQQLDTGIKALQDNIAGLSNKKQLASDRAARLSDSLRGTVVAIQAETAAIAKSSKSGTVLGRTMTAVGNAGKVALGGITAAAGAARGALLPLAASLGPIGIAMIALTVVTAAFQNGVKEVSDAAGAAQPKIDAIKQAIEDLRGPTQASNKELKGLGLIWKQFSLLITDIITPIKDLFDSLISDAPSKAKKNIDSLTASVVTLGTTLGLVALLFGGGPFVVAAAAVVGAAVAIGSATTAASTRTRVFRDSLNGTVEAARTQARELGVLANELEKFAAKANLGAEGSTGDGAASSEEQVKNLAKISAAYEQIKDGISDLRSQQSRLQDDANGYLQEIASLPKALQDAVPQYEKILRLQAEAKKLGASDDARRKAINEAKEIRRGLEDSLSQAGLASPENLASVEELVFKLNTVRAAEGEIASATAAVEASFNKAAKAAGLLTLDERANADTIENLKNKVDELKKQLETGLDPALKPEKWEEQNRLISQATVELQRLEDVASSLQSIELAAEIDKRIVSGDIANSLTNANRAVQALESASATIDISDPSLPGVLSRLNETQQRVEELNGRKAEITVEILEAGAIQSTSASIDRYVSALEASFKSVDLLGGNADAAIRKIQDVQRFRDAATRSSQELEEQSLQRRLASIDAIKSAESQAAQGYLSDLRAQLAEVDRIAQKRVDALSKPGPAERALSNLRRQELQQQARLGGRRGLEAAAELERLARQEKIAKIQAAAARRKEAIENKIRQEEKKQRNQEKQFWQEELAIQRRLLEIAEAKRKEEEATARAVLAARAGGGGGVPTADGSSSGAQAAAIDAAAAAQSRYEQSVAASVVQSNFLSISVAGAADAAQRLAGFVSSLPGFFQIASEASPVIGNSLELAAASAAALAPAVAETVEPAGDLAGLAARLPAPLDSSAKSGALLSGSMNLAKLRLSEGAISSREVEAALRGGAEQAERLAKAVAGLRNISIRVWVSDPGRWTGGPVTSGMTYRVNELGQEGYLSPSGRLSPISRPRNALWRAPSSGTVIPASLWSQLNAPSSSVKANPGRAAQAGASGRLLRGISKMLQAGSGPGAVQVNGMNDLARVQAHQAKEIGRLGRAVDELNRKDWNVSVNLRSSRRVSQLNAINNRI